MKRKESGEHPYVPKLKQHFAGRKVDRREFLRTATLLGVSATAAYEFAGRIEGRSFLPRASATDLPKGGHLRLAWRVPELDSPHTFAWGGSEYTRSTCEHLTRTGPDNVTRPWLCERWEASDDLKTWHLHLRKGVKWRNGRPFVADDAIWNLQRVLDPETGSSVLGLMKGYMMNEEGTALWDANAIEKVDDHTVRLNCRNAQLAVPEHLFHYPLHILDPEDGGKFGVGSKRHRSLRGGRGRNRGEGAHQEQQPPLVGGAGAPRLDGVPGSRRRPGSGCETRSSRSRFMAFRS